jgi:hypothetical protein
MLQGNQRTKPSIWTREPILVPENRVWRAVIQQAFEDAESAPGDAEAQCEPIEAVRARRYLRADSPFEEANLKLVCDFAELPADRVIASARRKFSPESSNESSLECGGSPPLFLPSEVQPVPQSPN